jgi:hypothetical protein
MRRAARYDGWLPNVLTKGAAGAATPEDIRAGTAWIRDVRTVEGLAVDGYDVICEGQTPAGDPEAAAAVVRPWRDAGATWWIEADWSVAREAVRDYAEERLAAGPPNVD